MKGKQLWHPEAAVASGDLCSSDPFSLLAKEASVLADYWKAAEARPDLGISELDEISPPGPPLDAGALRAAAATYSTATASTYDGFHPRSFAALSDAGLLCLGQLLMQIERLGRPPSQLAVIIYVLLPKPRGGLRPIAIFCGLYRLWAKARKPELMKWDMQFPRPFFACGTGRAPEDTVSRQALRAEHCAITAGHTVSVLWDAKKFFEQFGLKKLHAELVRWRWPAYLRRLPITVYGGPRVFTMQGYMLRPWYAEAGLPAGCVFALYMVKAYCTHAFDRVAAQHPRAQLDVYVDDMTLTVHGRNLHSVAEDAIEAGLALRDAVEVELAGSIVPEKGAIVASSLKLARKVGRGLGPAGGKVVGSTVNLGVDYAPGRCRRAHAASGKRASRLVAAAACEKRAGRLVRMSALKARKVYFRGIGPAA